MLRGADGRFSEITWDDAIARLAAKLNEAGGKVAVLSGAGRGTFTELLAEWTSAVGGRLVRWSPLDHEPLRAANRQVFGLDQLPAHDFGSAKYILSFGADFLETWLSPTENQRGFADAHGFADGDVAKFVYAAPRMDLTGLNADEWLATRPGTETALALAMANVRGGRARCGGPRGRHARQIHPGDGRAGDRHSGRADRAHREGVRGGAAEPGGGGRHRRAAMRARPSSAPPSTCSTTWRATSGRRSASAPISTAATATPRSPAWARRSTAARWPCCWCTMPTRSTRCPRPPGSPTGSRRCHSRSRPRSSSTRPPRAATCCCRSTTRSSGGTICAPRAGVRSLMQPVMEPVFNTRAPGDVLLQVSKKAGGALARFTAPTWEAHLRSRWQSLAAERKEADAEGFWRSALQRGGVFDEAGAAAPVALAASATDVAYTKPAFEGKGDFVFLAYPHGNLHDGRGTNKPWLLENADPVTKITWHSWVEVSPETAKALDIRNGEILRLTSAAGTIEAPAYIYLGLHPDVVAMPLGFGHTEYGGVRPGSRRQRARPARRAGRTTSWPTSPPASRSRRPTASAGSPRSRACRASSAAGIAEAMPLAAAKQGLTIKEAYLEEGHGEHEVNTEREVEALKGWRERQLQETRHGDYTRRPAAVGHGDRPGAVHRLPACVDGVLRREQHPDRGRAGDPQGPRDDLAPDRALLGGRRGAGRAGGGALRPDALPALRQRAVRAGLPGVRRVPHARRAQRPGLQPLRRHALLRQQLPVQGAVLQLVQVQRGRLAGAAPPAAQPGRDGARPAA